MAPLQAPRLTQALCAALLFATPALATPDFVFHDPLTQVYGESTGATMREPAAPRDGASTAIWARIGYSFWYTDVALYYTTDGSTPTGSFGLPAGTTGVLRSSTGGLTFVRNEPHSPANIDWWQGTLPAGTRAYGTRVKYRISAWHSGGGPEVFANNTGCGDGTCDDPAAPQAIFSYTVKLAWPGRGYPNASPNEGFPNTHFWKEEAVVGNNYMNVQLDQNGTVYDIYYPSAGCVLGMATKNEGYVDGNDTFPPGLPLGYRGQMNVNQAQAGLRVGGVTYWLSNEGGAYTGQTQAYVTDTNVVHSSSRLTISGHNILVDQYDFCPKGIDFPHDPGGNDICSIYIKRYLVTNNEAGLVTIDFYYNADFALNGGDSYDGMFADKPRGALIGYDNIQRSTSASGEYNPTSMSDYNKNVSVYMAAALKLCTSVGSASGVRATDSWADSSTDNDAGWVGIRLQLKPGGTEELDVAVVGGFDNFAGAAGTYSYQISNALDWFQQLSMASVQTSIENYWRNWLAAGTDVDFPDPAYRSLFRRALLATALHCDAKGGGVIAGMHNGAYPFVWPRDAVYAAITLDRTGHSFEAGEVYRFLRDADRDDESWGKGFWFQKYTTDGHKIWTSPQVDETANVPWGGYYHYLSTGAGSFLTDYYSMFNSAGHAMSENSLIDTRLYFDDAYALMHSNNVWEDNWDDFLYSNACVERGLRDAARIATATGHASDAALFTEHADTIHSGLDARLAWDGEYTDISQLGLVWPMESYPPTDPRMAHLVDRMNGVATDRDGLFCPIVNFSGEFQDLVDRYRVIRRDPYWADTYWNGGPWFLSTLWYGQFYAKRQDYNAGKGDIDNFKYRIDLVRNWLGPAGLGAEQMAPGSSQLYSGFPLQAAWPNAWESMSTIADSIMLFLDHRPDAPNQRILLAPKLPSGWSTMTFRNVKVGSVAVDVTCTESTTTDTQQFRNATGGTLGYDTYVRVPAVAVVTSVKQDESPIAYTYEPGPPRVHVSGSLPTAAGASTLLAVTFNDVPGDFNHDGYVNQADFDFFAGCRTGAGIPVTTELCRPADFDNDGDVDLDDFATFQRCYSGATLSTPACAQ